ncbi:MAG: tandem-95 repeat protein, partial [Acidobacteria bacterium]|nr:tandem-95 repeat protein [Acidobacteriota bacterium]
MLPNLNHGEGDDITLAVAATGFPNVTYSATGLPPGVTISTGLDSQGHVVGILSGTLPSGVGGEDPVTNAGTYTGSEGTYSVVVSASDGSTSNAFTWDIGRWGTGDVFVGAGEWKYQVYSQNGEFKYDVVVPDDPFNTWGATTGCAANWRTGEVWATNFDDVFPALNVIQRHAAGPGSPYTDVTRRLNTQRFVPGSPFVVDANPEAVAFDNAQNMYVGHSFGFVNANGDAADAAGQAIFLTDPPGAEGFVVVDATGMPLFDNAGAPIPYDQWVSPDGFYETFVDGLPVPLLNGGSQRIPVREQAGMDVHKYPLTVNGYLNSVRSFFDLRYGLTGVDTLDMMSDQRTAIYSSESQYLYRYDFQTSTQLPVVGSVNLSSSHPISTRPLYGVRVLAPGDGSGGFLVANEEHLERLDANGRIVQQYDVLDDPDYPDNNANGWFAIAIAPDGRSVWAATRTDVYRFDIASAAVIGTKIHVTDGLLHTNAELSGLCVMNEYRAAQEVCGATGLGNGIDDDGDGLIDEGCFRIEICSATNPGDDDGDGLVDYNDPDCGATEERQCAADGPTDPSVAGFCARANGEGELVSIQGIPRPCTDDCTNWTFNYTATGLPAGLTMDPETGAVTGTPLYSIVNPNTALTPPQVHAVTVQGSWTQTGQPASTFTLTFDWTIYNTNRTPTAVNDSAQTTAGSSLLIDVRANDSDVDGDPTTILSFTQPSNGTVTQVGQQLQYAAPTGFSGVVTFTYQIQDNYAPAGVSNVATVTVIVNGPPVARNDAYDMAAGTTLTVNAANGIISNAAGSDSDPEGQTISVQVGSVSTPTSGSVSVNSDGSFSYTPAPGFTGMATFTYRVTDGLLPSNTATVTIVVHAPPVAVDDAYSTMVNVPLAVGVLGGLLQNDFDPEGGTIRIVPGGWTNPSHGVVAPSGAGDGGFSYIPALNYVGTDSFTYRITNGRYESAMATVTITIVDANRPPVAQNDSYTADQGQLLTVVAGSILGNDSDPDRDLLTAELLTNPTPAGGVFVFTPLTGAFLYTSTPTFMGDVTFTYRVRDPFGLVSAPATVTIHVNAPPVARDDAYTVAEDTPLAVGVPSGLLANDSDPDSTSFRIVNGTVTPPAHGTVNVSQLGDGGFLYTPNANYTGTDTFTYQLTDGRLTSNFATVTITITPVNDRPVATPDAYTTLQDVTLNVTNATTGFIQANDTDVDDAVATLRATLVTSVSHGSLNFRADGTFDYNPTTGFAGTDTFTYFVTDPGSLTSNTTTVTITIQPKDITVQATAVCVNDSAYMNYSITPVNFTPTPGATAQVEWIDSTGATVRTDTAQPQSGQLLWPGMVLTTGQPTDWPGWVLSGGLWVAGADGFQNTKPVVTVRFTFTKTKSASVTYPVAITGCNPNPRANQAPTAVNDAYTTAEDTALTVPAAGILTNDTDPELGPLTVSLPILTQPTHGTVTQNANGSLTYTPATNYTGTDSYTYKAKDAAGNLSNTATVTITITPVNDPPVAVNDAATTPANTPVTVTVLTNDTDPDGDTLSVVSFTPPTTGTVTRTGNQLIFTPATGFSGLATFPYTITDGNGGTSTATVTITVLNTNRPPVAVNDSATTNAGVAVAIPVIGNDSDPDGDVISVISNTAAAHGTVTRSGNTFVYTPAIGFSGIDTFTYTISDGKGGTATATVTITVNGCVTGASTTFTQGGWGATPNGGNPGALLHARFASVYPAGYVQIGSTRTLRFTSAGAVTNFLPQGGTPSILSASATNTTWSAARVFAGQVLALQLNVDFSNAAVTRFGLGAQVLTSGKLAGYSVAQVLTLANGVIGASMSLPSGVTISDLNGIVDAINQNYDNGTRDNGYLRADSACGSTNRAPVAVNDGYAATKNTRLTIPTPGVKVNDSDPDGDAITAEIVAGTTHGTVTLNVDGSFTYMPTSNYVGTDTFTYKVKDSKGAYSNIATVTITISSVVCNLEAKNDA